MRISLLLEREPFGEIVEETLPILLHALRGRPYSVRWYADGRLEPGRRPHEQIWLCNPLLNAIFRPNASSASLEPVVREFRRSPRWWRRPLQHAYVSAATRSPTAAWLARPRLGVTPPLPEAEALVIAGGNHRLRIVDGPAGVCHVIAKPGAGRGFLEAELALRRRETELPIPRLRQVAASGDWFIEDLVRGTPLNRLVAGQASVQALHTARAVLADLVTRTARAMPVDAYLDALIAPLEDSLASIPPFAERRDGIVRTIRALAALATGARAVLTADTHGDFQAGNILVDGDAVWLIDWEYTARRQSAFDVLTHGLAVRFPAGLAARVRAAVAGGPPALHESLHAWPGVDWTTVGARSRTLAIFLLEELTVRVHEHADARVQAFSASTMRFLEEMDAAAMALQTTAPGGNSQ